MQVRWAGMWNLTNQFKLKEAVWPQRNRVRGVFWIAGITFQEHKLNRSVNAAHLTTSHFTQRTCCSHQWNLMCASGWAIKGQTFFEASIKDSSCVLFTAKEWTACGCIALALHCIKKLASWHANTSTYDLWKGMYLQNSRQRNPPVKMHSLLQLQHNAG